MKNYNISKDGTIILAEDKTYTKKELLMNFMNFIEYSNFSIEKNINNTEIPYQIIIKNIFLFKKYNWSRMGKETRN